MEKKLIFILINLVLERLIDYAKKFVLKVGMENLNQKPILVLGATGYIGARLVPLLLQHGNQVRVGYRSLNKLKNRIWSNHPNVKPFKLDVFDRESLEDAMKGCSAVYYLVHSMEGSEKDFVKKDRIAAQNTVIAADKTKIERIIYLGGLGETQSGIKLSKHLQSRIEVANILQSCSIPVTTLRAAIIIGTGSAAFEIMRYLTDRLPVMITPRWLRTKNQPIAVENVLIYLLQVLNIPETIGQTYDIGGPDILTYKQFMESYVEIAKLPKRIILPIPIFSPNISSYWIKFITGIPSSLARPLIDGMKNEVIVKDTRIQKLIPQRLFGHKEAISMAVNPNQFKEAFVYNQKSIIPSEWYHPGDIEWSGGTVFQNYKSVIIDSPSHTDYSPILEIILRIRNINFFNLYYKFGSFLDNLFRGKFIIPSHPWCINEKRNDDYIQLITSNNLPGKTFLTYRITKIEKQTIQVHQIFRIIPKGILGTLYWIMIEPFFNKFSHRLLSNIAERFEGTENKSIENIITIPKPYI